jgi:iron complex outermembrane receptor protein
VQQVYNPNTNTVTAVTHAVGANGLPGYGPDSVADQSRRSYAGYIDLEVDIIKDLTVGLAGRYEHFSDFGSTTNGKISARYAFTPEIAVRGAVSTGFKAPTPGQLFTRNVSTAFLVGTGVPYELGLIPPTDPAAKFYGATPMKPEKSTNYSAGVVLTPTNNVSVTIDYFNIKVSDRIGITGQIPVLDSDRTKLQALGVTNWATIGQLRYFTNGFATDTQGLDVVGSYDMQTDIGDFATTLSANYTSTEVRNRKNTVTPDGRSFVLIDDMSKGNIENVIPKVKGNIGETYTAGPWQVNGRVNVFGNYTQYTLINNVITPQTFGAQATVDLAVNYDVTDNLRLTAGGENVLNSYPSKERRGIYPITHSTANGSIYLDDAPDGYNGAFIYGRVSLRLD